MTDLRVWRVADEDWQTIFKRLLESKNVPNRPEGWPETPVVYYCRKNFAEEETVVSWLTDNGIPFHCMTTSMFEFFEFRREEDACLFLMRFQ